jgi:hypothetical protein
MAQNDAFALKNSGLNEFLFAELGTELNGSALTVLSTLARLGKDPWAQAAEWAKMPNAATVDSLTQSILRMPLCAASLVEARATAGRLVALLPRQTAAMSVTQGRPIMGSNISGWMPIAGFSVLLIAAMIAASLMTSPLPSVSPVASPVASPLAPAQTSSQGQ